MNFLVSWKTTLAGIGATLAAAGHLITQLSSGNTGSIGTDLPLILADRKSVV